MASIPVTGLSPKAPVLSHGFRDGDAERRGEAVEHGDADLELGDLTVEVPGA